MRSKTSIVSSFSFFPLLLFLSYGSRRWFLRLLYFCAPEFRGPPGEALAPLCRGSCHGNAVTEGVYAINTVKAIVRYSPTRTNRTPPPSRLTPTHLPLHAGRLTPLCFCV